MTHNQLTNAIHVRMSKLGMTAYRLHVLLRGKVSKQTVYNFVEHGEVIHTDSLVDIMDVLELTIVEKTSKPK